MNNNLILFLIFAIVMGSCSEEEPLRTIEPSAGLNSVDLSAPDPSQVSKYVRYIGDCETVNNGVYFTGDTLILSVSEQHSKTYFVETFTPQSPMLIKGSVPEISHYEYDLRDGYSLIKERNVSQLFFFYGNDTLFLDRDNKISLNQNACQLVFDSGEVFDGEEIGIIDEFRVGQIAARNRDAVSCIPVIFEMDAYLIYTSENLAMSHTLSNTDIAGWLQIE